MRHFLSLLIVWTPALAFADEVAFPKFKTQEIATDLTVGYAVLVMDVNEDGKPDIVVADSKRVVWYENPTWKVHTILQGKTSPDNVCLAALDIDGDGHLDLVLGADWKPFNTKSGGTLHWLKRGKTIDDEWSLHPIGEEPTVHRVRVARLGPKGEPHILLGPLMGRDSNAKANWTDGRPVRMLAYPIPKDPVRGPWVSIAVSEDLHVVHNFWPIPATGQRDDVLIASYEGVSLLQKEGAKWTTTRIGEGNQANQKSNRGTSEIKQGTLQGKRKFIATIEPWHGNQVVVYTPPTDPKEWWDRHVIDDHLRWGHAVWCADLDGDGDDELIIGVRDNPAKGDAFAEKCGVRMYKSSDGIGKKWSRTLLDEGGVAVEDMTVADLDGDGKPDIIAVGRATHNVRIYWNLGK